MKQVKDGTILVTGGAGFIGSHVADELLVRGHRVVVVDDLSGGFRSNIPKKAKFVKGSITDQEFINKLFDKHAFDYVFHFAAYAAEGLSFFIKHYNYENNLIGSINLITASINHDVKCFVFASSIAVYGTNQVPMREDMKPEPEDPYGISKYAVEMELQADNKMFGLNYVIFRSHNVYGERQNMSDMYRNVLGIFLNKAKDKKPFPIFGDGTQQRAFTHIADVAPIIADSIATPEAYNKVFNVGSSQPYTVRELGEEISKAMGIEPKFEYLPARNEVASAYCDHTLLNKVFNFKARISLKEGIKRTVEWAKTVDPKEPEPFSKIEIKKNLPPSWKQND